MIKIELLKVKRGGTQRCFTDVSESRHSSLVLVGAPAQACSSPLIRAKIKCSLRVDSLTLRRGAYFATLDLTNEGSLWDSQISITSLGPCSSWHSQRCFSAVGMSKSTPSHEWRKYLYTHVQNEPLCVSTG